MGRAAAPRQIYLLHSSVCAWAARRMNHPGATVVAGDQCHVPRSDLMASRDLDGIKSAIPVAISPTRFVSCCWVSPLHTLVLQPTVASHDEVGWTGGQPWPCYGLLRGFSWSAE